MARMLRRIPRSAELLVERGGNTIPDLTNFAIHDLIHPEDAISGPTRPGIKDSQDHHDCEYRRKIILDPATGIRPSDPTFRSRICACSSCSNWFNWKASWQGWGPEGPFFMFVPGSLIFEALANGCRTSLEFFNRNERDMMIKRSADRRSEVTDLVVCGIFRGENTYDLCRVEYKAPHFKGEQGDKNWGGGLPPVAAPLGNISSVYVSNRAAISDMSEPRAIEVARGWLARCFQDHSNCRPRGQHPSSVKPVRLVQVDVPEKDHIQLVQTSDVKSPVEYIALSYCWGGDQLGKTLKSNIRRRYQPFSLFGQAKTVRDAVLVTRNLGFSFLWIDSLCIVQNDEKDLAAELLRMPDIYEGAALTLSAAKSRTSAEGFLTPKSQITSSNTCGYRCPDGQVGLIQLQVPETPVYLETIHRRCWTLQEHLLSPRVLAFGDTGLRWRCRIANWFDGPWGESDFKMEYAEKSRVLANPAWTIILSDDLYEDSSCREVPSDEWFQLALNQVLLSEIARCATRDDSEGFSDTTLKAQVDWRGVRRSTRGKSEGISDTTLVLREWRHLIESSYTQRRVTNPADRLPAISALATKFNNVIPSRYLAGLWEAILPLELLWEAWHYRLDDWPAVGCDQASPFPSWSWASMATGAGISIEWWQTHVPTIITLQCESVLINLRYKEFPYGHVVQGVLKVTGHLMEVSCTSSGKDVPIFEPEEGLSWPESASDWNAAFVPKVNTSVDTPIRCPLIYGLLDELPAFTKLDNFFCLEILRRDINGFEKSWLPSAGLIITPLVGPEGNTSDMFIRVGRFESAPSNNNWDRPDDSIRGIGSPIFNLNQQYLANHMSDSLLFGMVGTCWAISTMWLLWCIISKIAESRRGLGLICSRIGEKLRGSTSWTKWRNGMRIVFITAWTLAFGFQFYIYINYLRTSGFVSQNWSFGQIVAITVWAPCLVEYFNLEIHHGEEGHDYRLASDLEVVERSIIHPSHLPSH